MPDNFHEIQIRLEDFDRGQLGSGQRDLEGEPLRLAIREHFEREFKSGLGAAEIVVTGSVIILRWRSEDAPATLVDQATNFLTGGDYGRGIALLEIVLRGDPDDRDALYNLGMALSDQGRLDEAEGFLRHLVDLDPGYVRGWIALGVARARKDDLEGAVVALRRALELDPDDGYALRNLGALLIGNESAWDEAVALLEKAAKFLPGDQQVWVNLGKLHERAGRLEEADAAYLKVLDINPASQLGQLAEEGRSRIAGQNFRSRGGRLRPDALMYCLGALEKFEGRPLPEIQKITFEIATLGMGGIDVNDPAEKYSLQSLPGKFSGLHLLCIEYVGFKRLDPGVDIGFDLSQEYAEAEKLHGSK